jgi:hypothetical protein
MTQLVDIIDEHPHALNYDLMRCGSRLRDWPDNGVSWGDLVSLVTHAQPDSATFKALNPHWQQDVSTDLLRSIEASLRWLQWAKTPDAPKGRNIPEPFLWPWEQPEDESIKGDAMTLDEAADWLKWDRELKSD